MANQDYYIFRWYKVKYFLLEEVLESRGGGILHTWHNSQCIK